MNASIKAGLFLVVLTICSSACWSEERDKFSILLNIGTPGPTTPQSDSRLVRFVLFSKAADPLQLVSRFDSVAQFLIDDGETLVFQFVRADAYLDHNGKKYRIADSEASKEVVRIDQETVGFINRNQKFEADFLVMKKIKRIRVVYSAYNGSADSGHWCGRREYTFDVERSKEGLVTFGGEFVGTFEPDITTGS